MVEVTEAESLKDRKGDRVVLRGSTLSKHKGYTSAWKDRAKAPMPSSTYLIIEKKHPIKPDKKFLKSSRVISSGSAVTSFQTLDRKK